MSSLHAAIHAQVTANTSLHQTIKSVNLYLAENTPTNRFVTLFIAELDPQTGILNYINAGHNPPLIGHINGKVEQLNRAVFRSELCRWRSLKSGKRSSNRARRW
jgi:sigma-B regulation protein RsbU (phosphoserine phosphatase)